MSEIAIAHKDYNVRGGGEVLAEELARCFDCPLYVGHGDPDNQPDNGLDIRELAPDSRLHSLIERGGVIRAIANVIQWRDNATELHDYDTVITSGNEPLWWMPKDVPTVVAYTHSTPRWMYDLYHQSEGFLGRTFQQLQRRGYEGTIKRPDVFVANSDLVARRINRYWNIPESQIQVVYPPVDTASLSPDAAPTGDYYVALSRLSTPKCFDEIIQAFNQTEHELIVAGDGPERERLEDMAGENVELVGYVSEERKRELLAEAKGFVYAATNEDFGMAPVEAMAAGTPVIGIAEGFTEYQIMDGVNGRLFERGELLPQLQAFDEKGVRWGEDRIAEFAQRFSTDRFHREMREVVKMAEEETEIQTPWESELQEPIVTSDGGENESS